MLVQLSISRWLVEYDADATRAGYAPLPVGTGCTCEDCRNFDAAAGRTFPPEFAALALTVGIDLLKPAELMHWDREPSGLMLTGGWFHFVGTIVSGAELWSDGDGIGWADMQPFAGLELGVSSHASLVPESFFGRSVVELQFNTRLPWVLGPGNAT